MGDILKFEPKHDIDSPALIEYMYAPEINATHPYAFRIIAKNPEAGVWLNRQQYIELLADLVEQFSEEA